MSLRLEMLQVARLAPKVLGDSALLVRDFLLRQLNGNGGFTDRTGRSDLYYTVFGIDGLIALQAELPVEKIRLYVLSFGDGEHLDFVHLCCLARVRAAAGLQSETACRAIIQRIEQFRSRDGGFNLQPDQMHGTVYACFLAFGAYQDLGRELPDALRVAQCLKGLETNDGAWANEYCAGSGSTNATAAAATLLRNLSMPINGSVGDWLLAQHHPQGGFVAFPGAPMPDLLSTATALHALAGMEVPLEAIREDCLDFIDTLWTNQGAFYGHWGDECTDCEYAFYALLALGHLSL
ncbi:MAG: prenyltransferase/squalene oxidase repeat-containing protein [Terrimicrobiaceae bacterium]